MIVRYQSPEHNVLVKSNRVKIHIQQIVSDCITVLTLCCDFVGNALGYHQTYSFQKAPSPYGVNSVSEYEGIERAHEVACFIEEHGEIAGDLLSHFGDSIDDAQKAMEDNYCGCYASLADYAEELTEETTEIPEHLAFYIDI